jgi:hypothetical protein
MSGEMPGGKSGSVCEAQDRPETIRGRGTYKIQSWHWRLKSRRQHWAPVYHSDSWPDIGIHECHPREVDLVPSGRDNVIGHHRTTTASTVRKLKVHPATFYFRQCDINSQVEGYNPDDLLLYEPGWSRTKRTTNKLQSKLLWQAVEGERRASIEQQLPAWSNPSSRQTDPLKKRWNRLPRWIVEANERLTGDELNRRSSLM